MGAKNFGVLKEESVLAECGAGESVAKLRAGPSVKPARFGRVLVIDDEVAVARTIQRLLGDRHEVEVRTSGPLAIELLESGADFDVILCDMSMPEVSGADIHSRVMASRPELAERFVFMTGGSFNARTREFFERTPNVRVDKPFDLDVLRGVVRDKVAKAR
jgi:CheY-like chemotaxis protein